MIPLPDSGDPPDGPSYFTKKKRLFRADARQWYVESLTAGTHEVHGRTQGKFLLIKLFPPPDSWTHRLYLRTVESASLLCKKTIPPDDSWDPTDLVADLWAY